MYDDYKIMGQKQFEKVAKEYSERLENVAILDNENMVISQNNVNDYSQKVNDKNNVNIGKKNN